MMKRSHSPSANEVESSSSSSSSADHGSRGPLKKKVKREMDEAEAQRLSPLNSPQPTAQASPEATSVPVSSDSSATAAIKTTSLSSSSSSSSVNSAPTSKVVTDGNESDASATGDDEDQKLPSGTYYKVGGRIRLPDKLMEYLNKNVLPDTLWWQPDGDGFAFNTESIQTEFLDKHFRGTKLTSFIRSLNRWGFRRIFYHSLAKNALSFHHPLFKKEKPQLIREMKMISCTSEKKNRSKNSSPTGSPTTSPQTVPETQAPAVAATAGAPADPVQNLLLSLLNGSGAPSAASRFQVQRPAAAPTDALQAILQLQQPTTTAATATATGNPLLSSIQALVRPQPAVNPLLSALGSSALGSLAPAPSATDPIQALLLQALQQQQQQQQPPAPAAAAPAPSVHQLLQDCILRGQQPQQTAQQHSQAILQLLAANIARSQSGE